ncbi:MAG: hypothetical protein ACPGYY_01855 [Bacteroidia bacterium]
MGLNISGIVIDKNYENSLTELETILDQKLVFEKEITFEDSLESWKEDTYCDVYFSKKGTFILTSMDMGGFEFYADNQTILSFILSEMTMMFTINYTKNNELIRSIMESEEMNEDVGKPFDFEKDEDDKSELIYHLIEKTLGESFYDIDIEVKCFRYSFKGEMTSSKNNGIGGDADKPWWKFW